jgi:APA family basic amino acid/polyamine antiporter
VIATNAGLIGISRLGFSLGQRGLTPKIFSRIHPRFQTPFVSILYSVPWYADTGAGFLFSGGLRKCGLPLCLRSLLAFMFSHASILALRIREPDLPRPFKLGWNIKIKRFELPITAILGLLFTTVIWVVINISQPYSRLVGISWMAIGIILYIVYVKKKHHDAG